MSTAQEEARIGAGSLDFYRTALPAGPILVLGFMCLEGKEVSSWRGEGGASKDTLLQVLSASCDIRAHGHHSLRRGPCQGLSTLCHGQLHVPACSA